MSDTYRVFLCCTSTHNNGSPFFRKPFFSVLKKRKVFSKYRNCTSSKKKKRHLCPCLFTAFHNRNPYSLSPYSLFCLIIDSPVCAFYSSFFPRFFFTLVGFLLPMDWKSERRGREGSQAGGKEMEEISISSKFPEVSFEVVCVCLPGLSFLSVLLLQ